MDKKIQIQLLLEYIAKSKSTPKDIQKAYIALLEGLVEYELCQQSVFTCKQIEEVLQNRANIQLAHYEIATYHLEKLLENRDLKEEKKSIFNSLMASNFPTHAKSLEKSKEDFEASLSKVEAKIYTIITLYIQIFLASLDIFMLLSQKEQREVAKITSFGILIHDALMKSILYKEEQRHMESGLKQLSVVYLGLYCKEYSF